MADLKISQLTLDTLSASDFVPIQRSTSNYKLNLKTAIQSCLGTMAVETATDYLAKSGNLSGLADASIARTNLGLGTTDAPRFTQLTLDVADNSGEGLSLGVSSWKIGRGLSSVLIYPPSASAKYAFRTTGLSIASGNIIAFTNDSDANSGSDDVILARASAANLRLGGAASATPVPQYFSVQNASGTNIAGADFTIVGSESTGNASTGRILFKTSVPGSSGSGQNTATTKLIISNNYISITGSEGLYIDPSAGSGTFKFSVGQYNGANLNSELPFGWTSGAVASGTPDTTLWRDSAAVVRLGANHATTPTAQTLKAHDVTTGTGASLTIGGGKGSVAGGSVVLATSVTNGALVAGLTVDSSQNVYAEGIMFKQGGADAASPTSRYSSVQSVAAGTANTAGVARYIDGSQGTGNATGGSIIFRTAAAGSSGSSQNALATALTIAGNKTSTFAGNIVIPQGNVSGTFDAGLQFSSASNTGLASNGSNISFWLNNIIAFNLSTLKDFRVPSDHVFAWSSATNNQSAADTYIARDAANVVAIRNSTSAQQLRVYNQYSSANEYLTFDWQTTSNTARLMTVKSGSGVARSMMIGTDNTAAITIDTTQNITFAALLKLVGTTSSYPALKRNSTGVDIRLADDSDYAPLAASTITANGTFVVTSAAINAQTGTTYTLQSSDNGKIITLTNASAITLTVPASLPVGFSCQVIQGGAGQVTFSASSTTINSYGSLLSLAGQYASASLISNITDVFVLAGNLI